MSSRDRPGRDGAWARLAATAAIVFLAAPNAKAEPPSPTPPSEPESVVLAAPSCKAVPFSIPSFVDSLRVELSESGLRCCMLARPDDGTPKLGSLHVGVEIVPCAPDADGVRVSVRDPGNSRAVERDLSWADVAEPARPRAMALAVAELIRSLQRSPRPAPVDAVQVALPAPAPPPQESRRASMLSLHFEAEARGFSSRETLAWGGRLRCTSHLRSLHVDLDAGANYARAHDDLGDVLVRAASGGLGVGPRFVLHGLIIDPGVRAEVGWAWVRGQPARANVHAGTGSNLTSSLGARLSLEAPARLRIRPGLVLESGAILRGIEGEASHRPLIGLAGYYATVAVAVGVSL